MVIGVLYVFSVNFGNVSTKRYKVHYIQLIYFVLADSTLHSRLNPFDARCSNLLLFEGRHTGLTNHF